MSIIECTKEFLEKVAKLKLSPPLRFGRVKAKRIPGIKGRTSDIDRLFVGICTEREMQMHLGKIEALIAEGGNAVERRIRGLS